MWVLHGDTGKVLDGWPIDLGGRFLATPLITRLRPRDQTLDVVSSHWFFVMTSRYNNDNNNN